MVSEMASFSTLEAQQNTNTLLASIQTQNAALYQAQSADLIGKSIQVTTNNVSLSGGTADIGVNMASAGNATLTITNASGQVVSTLGPGSLAAGDNTLQWNGTDANGNQLPDGNYTVSVAAASSTGAAITAYTTASAVVTDVSFVNNNVMVTAGGSQYALSSINEISQ
jgi:flagellar basal-body rod modification protein FlgD